MWWKLHYCFVLVHRLGFRECLNAESNYVKFHTTADGKQQWDIRTCTHVDDPCNLARTDELRIWCTEALQKCGIDTRGATILGPQSPMDFQSQRVTLDLKNILRVDNAAKIQKFLVEAGMENCSPEELPITKDLVKRMYAQQLEGCEVTSDDIHFVDSGIGKGLWLVETTHPSAATAISILASMKGDKCVPAVKDAVKHFYRWMKGAQWFCLELHPGEQGGLLISTDSDWGGFYSLNHEVHSRTGIMITHRNFPIKVYSGKQKMTGTSYEDEPKAWVQNDEMEGGDYVPLSSCEAEGTAAHEGTKLGLHYNYVMDENGEPSSLPIKVQVDASAFIAFSQKLGLGKMKHLDMRRRWVQLVKDRRIVEYIKIHTKINPADFFTKIFDKVEYRNAVVKSNPQMPADMQASLPVI